MQEMHCSHMRMSEYGKSSWCCHVTAFNTIACTPAVSNSSLGRNSAARSMLLLHKIMA
jgi:hypothetical protein